MARSIWSGSISFGLVNIPVRLVTAVRDSSIRFHLLTPDGTCRLRQKLYCPETGKEYDFKKAARGYEVAPDQYVLVDENEIARLKPEAGHSIQIVAFVELAQIDPSYFDRTYYLVPEKNGAKAYALLAAAMAEKRRVAVAQLVMRDQQHLAAIRSNGRALVLHTMYYDDEVVDLGSLEGLPATSSSAKAELKMADQLIQALSSTFRPAQFKDDFRDRLRGAIEAKADGAEIVSAPSDDREIPPTFNIMAALKKSLERTAKPGASVSKKTPDTKTASKKTAPKKTAATRPSRAAPAKRRRSA
ncbi:MAG: Ku protein [Phycisphaerae bacterium]|nr:Ku protein [Phycisphaerae bacterium]